MGLRSYILNKKKKIQFERKKEVDNKIRLIYINLDKFRKYGSKNDLIREKLYKSDIFQLPDGMNIEEAYKVISYLFDNVENNCSLNMASIQNVVAVSKILENFKFKRLTSDNDFFHKVCEYDKISEYTVVNCPREDGVIDLITIGGQKDQFKNTDMSDRYFNWYSKVSAWEFDYIYKEVGVTKAELDNIMKNSDCKRVVM